MRSVVALIVLLITTATSLADDELDQPRSTVSEWPPKKKPAPSPQPAPPPPPQPTPPPAKRELPPTVMPADEPKPSPRPNVQMIGGGPGSPMREVEVPKGKSLDDVKVPGAAMTNQPGLGEAITEIQVVDNAKTDPNTVEYIAGVKIGDLLTVELVDAAKTRLQSTGLFRDVNIYWVRSSMGGVKLMISARDKLSWVLAPVAAFSETNYGGGAVFAHGNVFGQNKKFLVYGQYTTAEKLLFIAFLDPNVRNSRFYYRADVLLRRDTLREYASGFLGAPRLERETDLDTVGFAFLAGLKFARKFFIDLRLKIYYDDVNPATCKNTRNADGSGTPDVVAEQGGWCHQPSSSGWDNTLTLTFAYDGRAKVDGVLSGLNVNVQYQYGASWLGTRWDYHLLNLWGMYGWKFNLGAWKSHNFILRMGADLEFDPPFKHEIEAGGPALRGYIYRQFRGDTAVRLTAEYIMPLFTVWDISVRLIAFYDSNLTWFRDLPNQDSTLSRFVVHGSGFRSYLPDTPSGAVRDSWNNGLGGGLRFFMKGVILPLLGVDFAYGIESNSFQYYVSIGSTLD